MAGADQPGLTPDSPQAWPSGAGSPGTARRRGPFRRRPASGTWAGSSIYVLFMLFLIIFAVHAAQQRQWARLAGDTVVVLLFLVIPTGGTKRLRHALRGRKPSEPPSRAG